MKKLPSDQLPSSLPTSPSEVGSSFEATYSRLKAAVGAKSDSEMAVALGIKQGSISVAKKRKALPPNWIEKIAKSYGVSADWLFFGTGSTRRDESLSFVEGIKPIDPDYSPTPVKPEPPPSPDEFKMTEMVTMTVEVLESETIYRTALASNIRAFHQAVRSERTLASLIDRVELLERKMEGLERENRQLKQNQEQLSHGKAVGEAG